MAQIEKVNRFNVTVSNVDNESRKYTIFAEAQIADENVENINNGVVKENDVQVATFNRWSANNLNVNFSNVANDEQCAILGEINAFVDSVEELSNVTAINI